MSKIVLKQCPFCKEKNIEIHENDIWTYIQCSECGCRTDEWITKEMAINAWNRRDEKS